LKLGNLLLKDVDLQMFTVKRGHENSLARNQSICCATL